MKGPRVRRQGSYDLAQDARPVVTALSLAEVGAATGTTSTSRQVTLQDILDLSPDKHSGHPLETSDLDFESSRVIVVNTKAGHRRKRSLSVSPRLGSRGSAVGSSCGSVSDTGAGHRGGSGGGAGGFYTWMQSSLRRRLRKRAKKSTLPRSQTPPPRPPHHSHRLQPDTTSTPLTHHHHHHHRPDTTLHRHHLAAPPPVDEQEVVTSSAQDGVSVATPSVSSTHPTSPTVSCSSDYHSYCNSTPSSSSVPTSPSSTSYPHSAPSPDSSSSCGCREERQEPVTYVNHRNGSVTAVSATSVLQALTSASSGAKSGGGSGRAGRAATGNRVVSSRLSQSARGRSTSVGRRVALSTSIVSASGNKKGGKKNKGKRHRVLGGAWGLFHCAGAGARSRSCTPERNVNFRVNRSRSATPERYINVRVNSPPVTATAAKGKGKKGTSVVANIMKGKSKRRGVSSRSRRSSAETDDDEANKENKYDMWGFIKERLEWSGSGRSPRPCAAERMSRRDTLPCRPRGSVNINRELGTGGDFCPPSPTTTDLPDLPDLPAMTRSVSERRYGDPRVPCWPLPPKDMCTYIHSVPPTTDVNFNNYGSVLSIHLKRGETLPRNLQNCASIHTSVASSLNSVGSKDSKDSGVSSHSGSGLGAAERSHSTHGPTPGSGWADGGSRDRTNTLPTRYRNRPLPPIPTPELPPKPPESGIHLVRTLKLDKFMKNKWISGVAVTKKGDLVVVDLKEAYLMDSEGNLKRTLGTAGKGALKEPIDVTILGNGNVAFSDHADQEVKVFSTKGQFVRRVRDKCLANIAGVAASTGDRRMYIAGTDKRCVTVHNEEEGYLYSIPSKDNNGASSGGSAHYGGTSGSSKELFEHPYSIAVNPLTGDIIVGDDYKQRVVALSATDGRVLWRYSPTGDRHFFPCSIAVDSEGYIFIADLYNEKVYMLDSSGKHLKVLLSRGDGLKGGPGAIAVDGRGHLVVADEERTLRVFKYGDKGFALYRRFSMCPDAK